jgi:hypothetical protein
MSKADPLGVRQHDPLTRWREKVEAQEETFAKARRERELEEQRERDENAVTRLRAEMQAELSAIQSRLDAIGQATGEALAEYSDKMFEHVEKVIKSTQSEMFVLVERRFGELMGRIDAFLSERPRPQPPKDFKFANEARDEIIDLPNPLRKMN